MVTAMNLEVTADAREFFTGKYVIWYFDRAEVTCVEVKGLRTAQLIWDTLSNNGYDMVNRRP